MIKENIHLKYQTTQSEDPEAFKGTQHDVDVLFEVLANNPKRHAKVNA